ncbi:MAG: imelysin family protein [Bacteroidia bacterium]
MKYYLLILSVLIFGACGGDDTPPVGVFDRGAMLEWYADAIIIPAYDEMVNESQKLVSSVDALTQAPDADKLTAARTQLKATLIAWQSANAFNFGPGGEAGLQKGLIEEIGTFPVSTTKVSDFINAGDTTLVNFDRDSRGLYAIAYLLHGLPEAPDTALEGLQNNNRAAYLRSISRDLLASVKTVRDTWKASFRADFVSRIGTDVGSGTSQLYNEFVRSFEAAKNFKVGLPLGKRPGQTGPEPQLVESRFAGHSKELLGAHLDAIDRIYKGQTSDGTSGKSLLEYVEAVEGGSALAVSTRDQWAKVIAAFDALPADKSLRELAASEAPELDLLHTEIQKHTRFFKSDMSSILGIAITFASGDGD